MNVSRAPTGCRALVDVSGSTGLEQFQGGSGAWHGLLYGFPGGTCLTNAGRKASWKRGSLVL